MPNVCKLPLFDYKASGCLAFYHLRLIEVIGHKELQTSVFHSFRELGNAVAFLTLLEENMVFAINSSTYSCSWVHLLIVSCLWNFSFATQTREEALDIELAMPFHGIIPAAVRGIAKFINPVLKFSSRYAEGENAEELARQAAEKMSFMNFERALSSSADAEVHYDLVC